MERNPGGWFEIYVDDMGRAVEFYEAVFGVTLENLESPTPGIEMMSFPVLDDRPGEVGGRCAWMRWHARVLQL